MATSQTPHRRPTLGGRSARKTAIPSEADLTPDPSVTPGHPNAQGTLPMAKYLTDLQTETEIQALARTAPRMTVDQAVRIGRLLRWDEYRPDVDEAA